jgi:hypothetical protein
MEKAVNIKNLREVPVSKLVKAKWNYKEDDEFRGEQLRRNLKRNGQIVNMIVRQLPSGKMEVLDGNHRLDAVVDLKWEKVYVYDLGKISNAAARRIAVEINETRFNSNLVKLSQAIAEIRKEFTLEELQETMPFRPEEFAAFSEMGAFDWSDDSEKPDTEGGLPADKVKLEFMLTQAQASVVNKALIRIVSEMGIDGEYRMSRALELIAADSLNTPIENFR